MIRKMCNKGCTCKPCQKKRESNRQAQADWRARHGRPRHSPSTWAQRFTENASKKTDGTETKQAG